MGKNNKSPDARRFFSFIDLPGMLAINKKENTS